ncbi:MAG: YihA family ribosome biogenesis GTP-binding protein [Desulfobacterales bacterium]|nr:YihA family ribosome biogenesis GTP-binding protein [Desulfobacterales bacterium]
MIIKSAKFVTSAVKPSQYPPALLPEIAFAGRSNVGKSTLINAILNRKHLVKTSSTPGRTQLINFFDINDNFTFVDLPGYGYAKVPDNIKKKWGPMIETYILNRKTLKAILVIMDIRRIPRQEEINLIEWLKYIRIPYIPILTKADKLSKSRQIKQKTAIANIFYLQENKLILFSAKSKKGRESIWDAIEEALESNLNYTQK